jgi:hypothetical protein
MWDLWWTKWYWDRFFPEYFGFSCQFHSTGAPLLEKGQKIIIIFILITGLHNKPQGCGASVASAVGPFFTLKMLYGLTVHALIYFSDALRKSAIFPIKILTKSIHAQQLQVEMFHTELYTQRKKTRKWG